MNTFYSYIYSLAVAAAAAGIVTALAPDGGQLKKYVKYAAALCVLVMLLLPAKNAVAALSGAFGDAFAGFDVGAASGLSASGATAPAEAESAVLAQTKVNLELELRSLLAVRLGCEADEVAVSVTLDDADLTAVGVSAVGLAIPGKYKTAGLELWVAERTGCAAGNVVIEWNSSES